MAWPALKRLPGLLIPLMLLAPLRSWGQADLFGRWQMQLRRCELEEKGARPSSCHALQLDQRNAEVVRLILQADGAGRGEQVQFTLVGALVDGSEPMTCSSGSCRLRKPMELQLISLSLTRFDGRGLAQALPSTWPVQGRCRIDPAQLSCQASARPLSQGDSAHLWRVDAALN
jgi:hypothetical protein